MKQSLGKTFYEQIVDRTGPNYAESVFSYLDKNKIKSIGDGLYELYKRPLARNEISENNARFVVQSHFFFYLFHKAGEKVFKFSEDLLTMLHHTSLDHLNTNMLQLPFQSIFINNIASLNLRLENPAFYLQSAFIMRFDRELFPEINYLIEELNLPLETTKEILGVFLVPNTLLHDSVVTDFHPFLIPLPQGDIYEYLNLILQRCKIQLGYNEEELNWFRKVFSLLFNCILYINSSGVKMDVVKPQKIDTSRIKNKAKLRKAENHTRIPYYDLGRDIVLTRRDREAFIRARENEIERHTLSWMVRGHWRNQPVGEGRKERKLIWIQPFRKGEDMAELINKQYTVK